RRRDLDHHIGRPCVADRSAGLGIEVVGQQRRLACAGLHDHRDPAIDQRGHRLRHQRHPSLIGTRLPDHPDRRSRTGGDIWTSLRICHDVTVCSLPHVGTARDTLTATTGHIYLASGSAVTMQTMAVDRLLPSQDAEDLITLTRDIADKLLDPIVDAHEKAKTYPEGGFAQRGAAGLRGLPQPEEWGGGGQPYEVYLQVLEEIAARWAAVAVAVSVHSLSSHPLLTFGTDEQKRRWLPEMLSGEQIGAYSRSEPQAGSDAAALQCKATEADGGYVINGSKSWIT